MKLAIMQPYFFPYIGYFNLIYSANYFIVYDTVQYIRRGWIHRNRVFHQDRHGWQYIVVPTNKADQKTPIDEISIVQNDDWRARAIGQIKHYEKYAPHAKETIDFVQKCLEIKDVSIAKLNVNILRRCADLLGIDFKHQFCSELNIQFNPESTAEEKILYLCEVLGASEYINLAGGMGLYHEGSFSDKKIKLTFLNTPTWVYETAPYTFEPNLSIIDLLMWNRPGEIVKFLDKYRI